MPNCWCPSCQGLVEHFVPGAQPLYNPVVQSKDISPERISDRAIELADARRPDVFEHRHVAIGKLLNNY